MIKMFGNNAAPPPAATGGQRFSGLSFSRPGRLPTGVGTYEIVRVGTMKNAFNEEKFYAILKCVDHAEAAHVGGSFSREVPLTGMYSKRSFEEIGRIIQNAYGPECVKMPDASFASLLDTYLLSDNWKTFNETQGIGGEPLPGRKLKIRVVPGQFKKDPNTGEEIRGINPKTKKPYDAPLPSHYYDVA